jgi:demethylmenaquinone methyltransferase/2-methoxy-6-polyprenyl-1,4-benzoquinol methylase
MQHAKHAPPSGLYDALSNRAEKQAWVDWVFSRIAARYDLGNDIMSLGWHTRWKHRAVAIADIQPHHRILDIACGTGDTTFMLAKLATEGEVVGTDINREMMVVAEQKRPDYAQGVSFVQADAGDLPFEDASFDRVICTYAGRGFPDWPAVVAEAYRVLKPGGLFLNLDFARPNFKLVDIGYRTWMFASGAVLGTVLHGHPKTYIYIPVSLAHYRGQHWLNERMKSAGFQTEVIETTLSLMAFNKGVRPYEDP